jgi:hypothetical protein
MKKILTFLLITSTLMSETFAQTTYDRVQDKSITASSTVIGQLVQKKFLGYNREQFEDINGILNLKVVTPDLSKFEMWKGVTDQRILTLETSYTTLNNRMIDSGRVYRADLTRLSIRISGAGQRIDNLGLIYATKRQVDSLNSERVDAGILLWKTVNEHTTFTGNQRQINKELTAQNEALKKEVDEFKAKFAKLAAALVE